MDIGPGDEVITTTHTFTATAEVVRYLGADVVLVDDLAGSEVLALCPQARVVHVGKRGGCASTPQVFIEKLLVREALAGHAVVRLKGGDVSLFGRAGEEIAALEAAGVDFEIVPGVTAGLAAAATLQCSLTHREHAHGVAFITAHGAEGAEIPWQALAHSALTLVVYMGVSRVASLRSSLLAGGLAADTPVIAVENASRVNARSVCATIGDMENEFARQALQSPAVLVIGEVLRVRAEQLAAQANSAVASARGVASR